MANLIGKTIHLLLMCMCGLALVSCISDKPALYSVTTNTVVVSLDMTNSFAFGNLALYGSSSNGSQSFARFYIGDPGEQTFELPHGNWTFYAVTWLTNTLKSCAIVNFDNGKTKKFLSLPLSAENCANSAFLGPNSSLNIGTPALPNFADTELEFCESVSGISSSADKCTDDLADAARKQARGNPGGYKWKLMAHDTSDGTSTNLSIGLSSGCLNGFSSTGLSGVATNNIIGKLPAGDGSTTPFYLRLEFYPDDITCSNTPKVVDLPHGLVSSNASTKYVVKSGAPFKHKLFVKYDGADVCVNGSNQTNATFAGGLGTAARPFLICNIDQLYNIFPSDTTAYTTYANYHYKLLSDVDLSPRIMGTNFNPVWNACSAAGSNFMPIGSNVSCAVVGSSTGSFDGGGKTIKGLKIIRGANWTGLYGNVSNFDIRRITFDSPTLQGTTNVGVAAGQASDSNLRKIKVLNPIISGSGSKVGSVTGSLHGGTASDLDVVSATMACNAQCGGVIGEAYDGTILPLNATRIFGSGNITSGNVNVGGVFGVFGTTTGLHTLSFSRFIGSVYGVRSVGGLIGLTVKARLENVYARINTIGATVNGGLGLGGLVGEFTDNQSGGGIYSSYVYIPNSSAISFSCTLNVASCGVNLVAGSSTDYLPTDFPSVAFPTTLALAGLSFQDVGQSQDPASFTLITPNWIDGGGGDLMVNYPDANWEFFNGSLPRLDVEFRNNGM